MTTFPSSGSEKRPILHEDGEDLPLGRPFLKEDYETIAKTFEKQFPIIESALWEVLNLAAKENPGMVTFVEDTKNDEDPESILGAVKKELKKNDPSLALAVIEAGLYSVNQGRETLERKKEEAEEVTTDSINEISDRIYIFQTLETRFSKAEDFLFTHSEFGEVLPLKDHLIQWIEDEKKDIEKMAKKEENEGIKKLYMSRLQSVVPAYDRFLKGQEVVGDYNTLLSALGERLQIIREMINDDLLEYMAAKNESKMAEIEKNTKLVYAIRSFMAIAEGERNERIALRR